MTHKIICYGDSNTYGACGFVGGRHAADSRWTGILHDSGLYEVVNLGENGREIPSDRWEFNELADFLRQEPDFDLLTIMLGTNDLLTMVRSGSAKVAVRMEQFLTELQNTQPNVCRTEQILLIAPPSTVLGKMAPSSAALDEACRELGDYYADIAGKLHIHFANASVWPVELGPDGVHMTVTGHQIFAEEMKKVLADIF